MKRVGNGISRYLYQVLVETMRLPKCPSLELQDYQNAPQKGKMVKKNGHGFFYIVK